MMTPLELSGAVVFGGIVLWHLLAFLRERVETEKADRAVERVVRVIGRVNEGLAEALKLLRGLDADVSDVADKLETLDHELADWRGSQEASQEALRADALRDRPLQRVRARRAELDARIQHARGKLLLDEPPQLATVEVRLDRRPIPPTGSNTWLLSLPAPLRISGLEDTDDRGMNAARLIRSIKIGTTEAMNPGPRSLLASGGVPVNVLREGVLDELVAAHQPIEIVFRSLHSEEIEPAVVLHAVCSTDALSALIGQHTGCEIEVVRDPRGFNSQPSKETPP